MNLLANLSPTYRESLFSSRMTAADEPGQPSRRLSAFTEMMDTLEGLKQNDPTLYRRVKQEATSYLRTVARTSDAALDIRKLAGRRRGAWLRSIANRWTATDSGRRAR
jgi:hypothetical protein